MNKTRIKAVSNRYYTVYYPQYQITWGWWRNMKSKKNEYLLSDMYSTVEEAEARIRKFILDKVDQELYEWRAGGKKVKYIEYP